MRNVFYSVINDITFKDRYYEAYKAHVDHFEIWFSIVCGLASAGSIFAWTQWAQHQAWWSIILIVAQVAQIVKTHLPYSRRLDALKYMIPEMHKLVIEVESQWFQMENLKDPDYLPVIDSFRNRYAELDAKYLGSDPLPDIKRLRTKAEKEAENHRNLYIGIMEGGDESGTASEDEFSPDNIPETNHT